MQTWLQVGHQQHASNPIHSWFLPNDPDCKLFLSLGKTCRVRSVFYHFPQTPRRICLSIHHEAGFLFQWQEGKMQIGFLMAVSSMFQLLKITFMETLLGTIVYVNLFNPSNPVSQVCSCHIAGKGDGSSERYPVESHRGNKEPARLGWVFWHQVQYCFPPNVCPDSHKLVPTGQPKEDI